MKKRRELDALVNGKLGRRKKGQHHELLMNDSDSSEVEEFSVSDKDVVRKRGSSSRACATCLIVFGFIVLVACVIAISGLVFVYVNIEGDVRQLRSQLDKVTGQSKSNPEEFQEIHKQQRELLKEIKDMKTGNGGILHNQMNITLILKQLRKLNATTLTLSESLAAAPQLKALPNTVKDLKQEIADVGSKLTSLQQSIEDLQNNKRALTEKVDSMKKKLSRMVLVVSGATEKPGNVKPTEAASPEMVQEISGLSAALTKMNTSTWQQFGVVMARGQQHEVQIAGLRNVTHDFESRLRLVELAGGTRPEYNLSAVMHQAVNSVKDEMLNLSESAGESAVSALRADITALNRTLHNINTVQKSNVSTGSAQSSPPGVTSLSSYVSSNNDKVQQLQRNLASVVVNITALGTRMKSQEDRLSVVETSIKSIHDVPTKDTRTTDSTTHMSQSDGVRRTNDQSDGVRKSNDQSDQSDQQTLQTSKVEQISGSDTKNSVKVGTSQTGSINLQDILIHENLPGGRTGSAGTQDDNPVETQTKTTPPLTKHSLKSAEGSSATVTQANSATTTTSKEGNP